MLNLIEQIKQENPALEINETELSSILENTQTENISWVIRIFATIGAWFSMIMFMGFLGAMKLYDSGEMSLLLGIAFVVTSLILSNQKHKNLFLEPLILAMGMIGQGSIIAGMFILKIETQLILLLSIGLFGGVFYFSKSHTQHFISIIAMVLCMLGLLWDIKLFSGIHLLSGILVALFGALMLWEEKIFHLFKQRLNTYNTLLFSLSIAITLLFGLYSFSKMNHIGVFDKELISFDWLSSLMTILCTIYAVFHLSKEKQVNQSYFYPLFIGMSILIGSTFWISAGITWSILLIILGVFRSQKIILGIGIITFLYFLGLFYYGLHISLLIKSIILISSGILFMGVGVLIRLKFLTHDEK